MVLLLLGGLGLYAKHEIVDERNFADRASAALKDDDVRDVIAAEITDALVNEASADLLVVRPLLESAVAAIIGTPQFRTLFELAVRDAHGVVLGREDSSVIIELDRAGALLVDALRGISPQIAKRVPEDIQPTLARLDVDDARARRRPHAAGLRRPASTLFLILAARPRRRGGGGRAKPPGARSRSSAWGWRWPALLTAGLVAIGGRVVSDQASAATDDKATFAVAALWERLFGDLRDVSITRDRHRARLRGGRRRRREGGRARRAARLGAGRAAVAVAVGARGPRRGASARRPRAASPSPSLVLRILVFGSAGCCSSSAPPS